MDGYTRLAREIKKRDNSVRLGICVGEVTGFEPVTIRTYYKGVPFDFTQFYTIYGLMNEASDITTGDLIMRTGEYPYQIGDKYICMFAEDNQSIYILGKFESIKDLNIKLGG